MQKTGGKEFFGVSFWVKEDWSFITDGTRRRRREREIERKKVVWFLEKSSFFLAPILFFYLKFDFNYYIKLRVHFYLASSG